ncbi:hypothetical protein HCN44_007804 [Aphidius gifuensis]|uniref:C2H2-type domain-containing protein n=1 Tax=Aphidius gifuensis TaxID=684658 RepID=A0A834XK47_APHGI|nr:zinc finger protein with KRAB and SCAN domains 7-like [Aphidius gifuensis]KAF7988272.1 hypothetical protein HCN44_007804 [Aphidius gifuensis]
MFGQVQIKQEYSGSEDNSQNGTNGVQTAPEYTGFTNQDVEYMYRQIPQFWQQSQIPTLHIPDDIPSKSDHQPRSSMSHQTSQSGQQASSPAYLPQPIFQLNNQAEVQAMLQPSQSRQPQENQQAHLSSLINIHQQRLQITENSSSSSSTIRPQTSPTKQNGPGRPPKTTTTTSTTNTTSKKLKCQCEICFKEFGHKSNLFIHMRTHNGERPYKCAQCDKCFTHSGNLAIHMRTHSGERPYACQICGKMFSHSGNLSTHLRTHSGVKPYKCSICGKEFRHSGNLSIHERIHSGIKPFHCKVCGKEFYHSGNLTTHMKKHPIDKDNIKCDSAEQQLQHNSNVMRLAINAAAAASASSSSDSIINVGNQSDTMNTKSSDDDINNTTPTTQTSSFVPSTS